MMRDRRLPDAESLPKLADAQAGTFFFSTAMSLAALGQPHEDGQAMRVG
jgi:hypothetical protein